MTMAKRLPPSVTISSRMKELLYRGNDDLLSLFDEFSQVAGVLGVPDRRAHLHELFDGRLNLVIEYPSIGHHDDGVEDLLILTLDADELV